MLSTNPYRTLGQINSNSHVPNLADMKGQLENLENKTNVLERIANTGSNKMEKHIKGNNSLTIENRNLRGASRKILGCENKSRVFRWKSDSNRDILRSWRKSFLTETIIKL
jgi:regulator of replication initiation timing